MPVKLKWVESGFDRNRTNAERRDATPIKLFFMASSSHSVLEYFSMVCRNGLKMTQEIYLIDNYNT